MFQQIQSAVCNIKFSPRQNLFICYKQYFAPKLYIYIYTLFTYETVYFHVPATDINHYDCTVVFFSKCFLRRRMKSK